MIGAIRLQGAGQDNDPWPVVNGKVDNLPLGPYGRPTSRGMRREGGKIVESLSDFQSRLQELLDRRKVPRARRRSQPLSLF